MGAPAYRHGSHTLRRALVALVAAAAASGCERPPAGGIDAGTSSDPLVGAWRGHTALGTGESVDYTLTFHADDTLAVQDTIHYPAGDPNLAGCTETDDGTGVTWSDTAGEAGMVLMLDQSHALDTTAITGCANPDDNESAQTNPGTDVIQGSPFMYSIDGATLTLTPLGPTGGQLVLTRQ